MLSTWLTTKAIPAGGLDVPRFATNWEPSQSGGRSTVRARGDPFTSVPATIKCATWRPALGTVDGDAAEEGTAATDGAIAADGVTAVGGVTADDGVIAADGLQAVPTTTTAAAATAILSVMFTGRTLPADHVGGPEPSCGETGDVRRFHPV